MRCLAQFKQLTSCFLKRLLQAAATVKLSCDFATSSNGPSDIWNILAFKVSGFGDVVVSREERCILFTQGSADLFDVPDKKLSFMAFRIGILR